MRLLVLALKAGAAALAVLLVYNVATMSPGTRAFWRMLWDHARQGHIGVGVPGANSFDFGAADLEPGDIVLGANPGNSWGHWTHSALYVGDGQVIDTLLRLGVHRSPVERFTYAYQEAGYLKVRLPREIKERAVAYALAQQGRPFNMLAPRHSGRWFYCIQMVWWAYKQAGYDLDPAGGYWVVPDRFTLDPNVELFASPRTF